MDEYQIDSKVSFGGYEWRVLDMQINAALIITEDIIEQHSYHDQYEDTTWADSAIRRYLNGEFYDRFTASDKARIVQVTNKNPDNPWYSTTGGADTLDHIFLLSVEEVCKYFGDSSAFLQNRGKVKYWNKKDPNLGKRAAMFKGSGWWWWARSPGRVHRGAVYIHGDGCVGVNGNPTIFRGKNSGVPHRLDGNDGITRNGGVRPALWLKMK